MRRQSPAPHHYYNRHFISTFQIFAVVLIFFIITWVILRQRQSSNLLRGSFESPTNIFQELLHISEITDFSVINHVVIVAGHAVMRVSKLSTADTNDNGWYLLSYQKKRGFAEIISSHIQKGIEITARDPNSILIFSGGQTRKDVGPISEGLSYYLLAKHKNWILPGMDNHIYLEEYAKDSFENLLFSIARFKEVTNRYPTKVTVVGFDFKSYRFTELHRKAVRFPVQNFTYVGLHPTHPNFDHESAQQGENAAIEEFINDMYGCKALSLVVKRQKRNPFRRFTPYPLSCPEIRSLLTWCGATLYNKPESLPWTQNQ